MSEINSFADGSCVGRRIGAFFKEYRLQAELTLAEVAECLELDHPSLVGQFESGELTIPLYQVFALSNLYNVAPDRVTQLFYELANEVGVSSVNPPIPIWRARSNSKR